MNTMPRAARAGQPAIPAELVIDTARHGRATEPRATAALVPVIAAPPTVAVCAPLLRWVRCADVDDPSGAQRRRVAW
ncbi:hypothetical protein BOX37_00380 [Nocardia mangyaensis]|uniref:Uncharacterized protein n=1 Tax=Nocardia mangyaensis TaxID=2213200 RepID=A0A1J0VL07_9NOCA|nr:hypothetical protein BOX37_00380 [Nocardia mangyaensis]